MIKKIILFFLLFITFGYNFVLADSIPVENIFSDIDTDYKYYEQLQALYDKGMIYPDDDGKFNPNDLLNRDEFVGITMEVSCKDCISPDTDYEYIKAYSDTDLFFDLSQNNKYFYCVAEAENSGIISGYYEGTVCEDGTYMDSEKPFCPDNTIILEEAIAIILRASGILSNSEAEYIRGQIAAGLITEDLSDDVSPLNLDGSVYSFYPDIQKALEYEVVTYDSDGTEKIYNLIELVDGKVRPKQAISKEKFLQIAYVALKANSCQEKIDDNIALDIDIFDEICDADSVENCDFSELSGDETIYDFMGVVGLPEGDSIDENSGYIWRFYDYSTGEEDKEYGYYIDDYNFETSGKYRVYLRAISDNGNTGEVYADIQIGEETTLDIGENNNFKVSIDADPISGTSPLVVDLSGIASGDSSGYSYFWDYGDGNSSFGKDVTYVYKEDGVYEVTLAVTDYNNNIVYSTVLISVGSYEVEDDFDGDVGLVIDIYDDSCSEGNIDNCDLSNLDGEESVFDFNGVVGLSEGDSIDEETGYVWTFYNIETENEIVKYGKYIDDYEFLDDGLYRVYLDVETNKGYTGTIYTDLEISTSDDTDLENNNLKVSIDADPIVGSAPLNVNFTGIASGEGEGLTYTWDYGDGNTGVGESVSNVYSQDGVYEVKLTVTDDDGNISYSTALINVLSGSDYSLGLDINIYDDSCSEENIDSCDYSDLSGDETIYDFMGVVGLGEGDSIDDSDYVWTYVNKDTGEEITKYGRYVDNYDFLENGEYRVYLNATSNKGYTGEVYTDLVINDGTLFSGEDENITLSIDANPIVGNYPLYVDFEGILSGSSDSYTYSWNYGDGNTGVGGVVSNTYTQNGVYQVILTATDSEGNKSYSTVLINVLQGSDVDLDGIADVDDYEVNTDIDNIAFICTQSDIDSGLYDCDSEETLGVYSEEKEDSLSGDIDNDGISDGEDACPVVYGEEENSGCPIFDDLCTESSDCDDGYYCSSNGICSPQEYEESCEYTGGDLIYGNVVCNSCPCSNIVNFNSTIRNCDIIFPAITSPDQTTIYSVGDYFEVEE